MKLEYLKGADNKIADTLSRVATGKSWDEHAVAELLDYARNSYKTSGRDGQHEHYRGGGAR